MSLESNSFLIDCMKHMVNIPDKYYDIAICDPNYGIGKDGSNNKSRGLLAKSKDYKPYYGNDNESPPIEYFEELFRISKNQIIFGANHFISKMPFDSSCWIIWDKVNGKTDFADCEMAWTSFKTATRLFGFMWNGMLQGKDISNGHIPQGNKKKCEIRIHPNQKPVKLYEWILLNYAEKGMKIFDSHKGSGSLRIACDNFGCNYDGCDIDEHYFNLEEKRWKDHKSQMVMSF